MYVCVVSVVKNIQIGQSIFSFWPAVDVNVQIIADNTNIVTPALARCNIDVRARLFKTNVQN